MRRSELLKLAKPILFNSEMVRAIMDGRKTVTRRIIKLPKCGYWDNDPPRGVIPRYKNGDILYVRETFMEHRTYFIKNIFDDPTILYKADYLGDEDLMNCGIDRWKPSIHMPKKYARTFLEVTGVRVERLQSIQEEDCFKEGALSYENYRHFDGDLMQPCVPFYRFIDLWNSTIKKD
ncbi:hypothetical protein, partial [Anaerorhabdus sp.]|uniref:hypothetical protein n=1 Tax=Anaerorhabdus sp. TaxID=1872524 RepID=UPI002B211F8B